MNTDHDEIEQLLGRQLRHQVDGMGGHPLGLGDVKGRARQIRRNRRIAAGVGVAAAVAVLTPVALLAAQGLDGAGDEVPPAGPGPVEVARTTLTLEGLGRGDAPEVEYFTPQGVVLPGEGLQELDRSLQALVPSPADGGWVAVGPDGFEVEYLDEDFGSRGGAAKNQSFVTTPDRSHYAFVAVEPGAQQLVVRSTSDPEGGQVWNLPGGDVTTEVVDFVGEDRVVLETTDRSDGSRGLAIAEPDGSLTDLPGHVKAISASPLTGLVAVQTESNQDGSGCFGVIDPDRPARPVWDTCAHSLGSFSPDGRHLMASGPYLSGEGPVTLDVLDARSGTLVASFTQASDSQITLIGPTWESADAIVSPAFEGEASTILRFGLDGTLEETVDRREKYVGDRYFYLGQDRRGM